jgi:hypothetical protein
MGAFLFLLTTSVAYDEALQWMIYSLYLKISCFIPMAAIPAYAGMAKAEGKQGIFTSDEYR